MVSGHLNITQQTPLCATLELQGQGLGRHVPCAYLTLQEPSARTS